MKKKSNSNSTVYSIASTYEGAANYNVNPRTGNLELSLSPPSIIGFFGGIITPSISYSQSKVESGEMLLGLPLGWSFNLSYISMGSITINGKTIYEIDPLYSSGLKYYELLNLHFKYHNKTPLRNDPNRTYVNTLEFQSGEVQYFDENGLLIAIEDRFGNHIIIEYIGGGGVYNSKIDKIIDSNKKEIKFSYKDERIDIIYHQTSNTISFSYLFDKNTNLLTGYIDPNGKTIQIINNGGFNKNLISEVHYPNNLRVEYHYGNINYSDGYLEVVETMIEKYEKELRTLHFNYDPIGNGHNYTGYPVYRATKFDEDPLLQSHDNQYFYTTLIDDGLLVTEYKYNFLHLELEKQTYSKSDCSQILSKQTNSYQGQDTLGFFTSFAELPVNYQMPTCVLTEVYKDRKVRRYKAESSFDKYGELIGTCSYESSMDGELFLKGTTVFIYDHENYGLLVQSDNTEYRSVLCKTTSKRTRVVNELLKNNKNISKSTFGPVITDNSNEIFEPKKKSIFEYDSAGRVKSVEYSWTDELSHELKSTFQLTSYEITEQELITRITDAQGNTGTTKTNVVTGWLNSQTDALGAQTKYFYDNTGRTISETNSVDVTTCWSYEDYINKVTTTFSNGYEIYQYSNGFGLPVKSSDNMTKDRKERTLEINEYDPNGRLKYTEGILGDNSRVITEYSQYGLPKSIENSQGDVISGENDPVTLLNKSFFNDQELYEVEVNEQLSPVKIVKSNFPSRTSTVSSSQYNNYEQIISNVLDTDSPGKEWRKTHYKYNYASQLQIVNVEGSDGIIANKEIQRDLFSNITNTVVATGHINEKKVSTASSSTLFYNNLNQLIEERNQLGQSYCYSYDKAGRLDSYTDYNGITFTYSYFSNSQIRSECYVDDQGILHEKKFEYDLVSRFFVSIEDFVNGESVGKIIYDYFIDGTLKSMIYPDGKSIKYVYDEDTAQLSSFTDAFGHQTLYFYDQFGRLNKMECPDSNNSLCFNYYTKDESKINSGKIKSTRINNGLETLYHYNNSGILISKTQIDSTLEVTKNEIIKQIYKLDDLTGNIIEATYSSALNPRCENLNYKCVYEYNCLNQLTMEEKKDKMGTRLHTTRYTYDAANNLLTESILDKSRKLTRKIYQYDQDNKLKNICSVNSNITIKYDPSGNVINDGMGNKFDYDNKNRLVEHTNTLNGACSRYGYYPDGTRSHKWVDNELIKYFYDGNSVANIVNEEQGDKHSHYLMLSSQRYIRFVSDAYNTDIDYLLSNYKDTFAVISNSDTLKTSYSYCPYGAQKKLTTNKSSSILNISENPFQYTQEYTDSESGLIYLRARYYNPMIKRFMTRDKEHLFNRYNYANSNPVMESDPTGRNASAGFIGVVVTVLQVIAVVALVVIVVEALTGNKSSGSSSSQSDASSGSSSSKSDTNDTNNSQGAEINGSQAREFFRRSNPGLSGSLSDRQQQAVSIVYPELMLRSGLSGGTEVPRTQSDNVGNVYQQQQMNNIQNQGVVADQAAQIQQMMAVERERERVRRRRAFRGHVFQNILLFLAFLAVYIIDNSNSDDYDISYETIGFGSGLIVLSALFQIINRGYWYSIINGVISGGLTILLGIYSGHSRPRLNLFFINLFYFSLSSSLLIALRASE